MFLQTNDRIINLKNVSNINVLTDRNRIVFNLNYSIEMPANEWYTSKTISDYVYWDAIDLENLQHNLVHLYSNRYFKNNFINHNDNNGFINVNEISSIKFSDKKFRVIFNLSHPVTFVDFDGNAKITSEFVYANCAEINKYNEYVEYIKKELLGE